METWVGVRLLRNHASHVPDVRFLHFAYPISGSASSSGSFILRTRFSRRSLETRFHMRLQDRVEPEAPGSHRNRKHPNPIPTFYFAYLNTPVIMKPKRRAILVRLPESLVDRLDAVAFDLRMRSRSDYIRRSLERALDFSEAHEVPLLDNPELQRALAR
jgi:Ribbon-helix-helix protein, copG family